MALLSQLLIGENTTMVVGTTHKLDGYKESIRQYIGNLPTIIGGDQEWGFCERVGLSHEDDKSPATWPASCTSTGKARGDIICSNMHIDVPEETSVPCLETSVGLRLKIGDHAITYVTLSSHLKASTA
jgi:hypothetical protein